MNLAELERAQALNVQPIVRQAMTLFTGYAGTRVLTSTWMELLRLLYSAVFPASMRAAELSRNNYDWAREQAGLPHHPIPLAELTFEQFVRDMEPVRGSIQRGTVTEGQIHLAALRAARSVENAGRRTVMLAVEDPDPGLEAVSQAEAPRQRSRGSSLVKGWARVATGRETCGWCLMLVSRGPVYRSAASAGSRMDDRNAMQMVGAQEFKPDEHMNAWHTGCDCKVVPVFRLDNWDGRDRYLAAERLWRDVTKGYSGHEATKAFRRAVEAGEYQEYLNPQRTAA